MRLLRRLFALLIFAPLAVLLIALGVANRGSVRIALDPFMPEQPALSVDAPLYLALFCALLVGVLIGGFSNILSQERRRQRVRKLRADVMRLESERDDLRRRMAGSETNASVRNPSFGRRVA